MIYADNAATTKISDLAFEKMLPFLQEQYGNAGGQYSLGMKAKRAIENARKQVTSAIGAKPDEITFTSGGAEANSWVLQGVVRLYVSEPVHIITTTFEHHSVLNACQDLEFRDISVTYIPVDATGVVSPDEVLASIRPDTKLVSIMLANNEIGTIQPIKEIGQELRKRGVLFHTDAVQAVGHIPINVDKLNVDFLTASAHKFNGAKGVGFLYARKGNHLPHMIYGGNQEHGNRGGTENVAGIVSLGYALEENISEMEQVTTQLKAMVEEILKQIRKRIPNVRVNGSADEKLPGILNVGLDGVSGEAIMHLLDLKGICVSTSSACTSGQNIPSHVLLALGQTLEQAKSAIRISLGRYNTMNDAIVISDGICTAYSKINAL
jgi:cysteine desulfurase